MMTRLKVVAVATLALSSLTAMKPAAAALFSKADLNPNQLILVASPYGSNAHQLLIVEQVSNKRACWSEGGSSPTMVEPLLADFDFTGICGRSTDANGYSIRMGDQDLGLQYSLRVVQRDGDLLLLGVPNSARSEPEIQIGRAGGVTNGFAKLYLNPGWRLTRRVYNNQPLGHFYLTNDQPLDSAIAAAPVQPASLPAPKPLLLPVSRPEIVITPGSSTPPLFPQSTSTSIAIPVPPPESLAAGSTTTGSTTTGSTLPLPASTALPTSNDAVNIPVINVPAKVPVARSKKPAVTSSRSTASRSSTKRSSTKRSSSKGKPIRTPLPSAAKRPIVSVPSEAMQAPFTQSAANQPVISSPVISPPVISSPVISQPPATPSQLPPAAPQTVRPGDFVVPTTTL